MRRRRRVPRTRFGWLGTVLTISIVAFGQTAVGQVGHSRPPTLTVYQVGGLDQTVLGSAISSAAQAASQWVVVHRGTLQLVQVTRGSSVVQAPPAGFRVPMSAMALDPVRGRDVIGDVAADALRRGQLVMGRTSADLRGARAGDEVTFVGWDGSTQVRELGAVVDDHLVSWAELVFADEDAASFGFTRASSVVTWGHEHRDEFIIETWRRIPEALVRIDASDDPWDPDSVLPTSVVKAEFGEFSYRVTGPGDRIEVDPQWRADNIVTVDLPLLGLFRCHKAVVPGIEAALADITDAGVAGEISFSDFQIAGGCWNARLIRGGDKGGAVSRHSWGIAIDINPSDNPYGGAIDMPKEIVDAFRSQGFAWGGGWTFSDGAHFEWTHQPGGSTTQPTISGS